MGEKLFFRNKSNFRQLQITSVGPISSNKKIKTYFSYENKELNARS